MQIDMDALLATVVISLYYNRAYSILIYYDMNNILA